VGKCPDFKDNQQQRLTVRACAGENNVAEVAGRPSTSTRKEKDAAMPVSERPLLRHYLTAVEDDDDPRFILVSDRLRISPGALRLPKHEFLWLRMCDGEHTLRDIQAEAMSLLGGRLIPLDWIAKFVDQLEEVLFLDTPEFRAHVEGPVRPPSCIGCYEEEPDALRRQLRNLFTHPKGPGLPRDVRPEGRLQAALLPHIDYARGGVTYAWGFKEVAEQTNASLFIIIGTSHLSANRFTLTRKAFQTPLATTPTDQGFLDRLEKHYGDGLYDDEWGAHLPEWSIELEVVFLQYLYERERPIRIVPLVVGSFHDAVHSGKDPTQREDIGRMIEALRRTVAETPEPICTIISGDLAHIGPKFDDPDLPQSFLDRSRAQDQKLMQRAEAADAAGYFRVIADEGDARRICGLPPTYLALEALRPSSGKLLHYDQYVHPHGVESVSFASMGFYKDK
jgi:AmmeMemoRadiSam system protein B